MLRVQPLSLAIATGAFTVMCGIVPTWAQDASPWDTETHAAARLIAGSLVKSPTAAYLRAGIEIRLDPGWKTYWRDPGDSGMPPTFDFAGSQNVQSVTVLWPAPERFPDGAGGNSIGYVSHVILPLRITPEVAARGASMQVKLNYDICGNLCVPAEAKLSLDLAGHGAEETALEHAEALVPRRTAMGAAVNGLAILSVRREAAGTHDRVVVEVAAPDGASVDLFAEGPTADWALPLPEPIGPPARTRRFAFDLDGLPPGAQAKGATLTLTAVSGDNAIEVAANLD